VRQISISHGRTFPREARIKLGEKTNSIEERVRVLERIIEQLQRNIIELDQSAGGDIRDRMVVKSKGVDLEVAVPHNLSRPPTDFRVLNQVGGDGTIRQSRSSLADEKNVYFKTTALKGVRFRIELLVLDDALSSTAEREPFFISDEDVQAGLIGE
jgi:hypothetical protein